MTVLLDEQIDVRMRELLRPLSVFTLNEKEWTGLKNGELRQKLNEHGFTHFVTADKNFPFQQNFSKIQFTTILIDTPTLLWEHQRQFANKIRLAIEQRLGHGLVKLVHVSLEGLSRGKRVDDLKKLLPAELLFFREDAIGKRLRRASQTPIPSIRVTDADERGSSENPSDRVV